MVCVLTYDAPHRKTQDLLLHLRDKGHRDIEVVATPWRPRAKRTPLAPHRPDQADPLPPEAFAAKLGYGFAATDEAGLSSLFAGKDPELVLIGGAGILPREIVTRWTVINGHPGFLPHVRGLDALKWAIYEDKPIGATIHVADEQPDAGRLVRQALVALEKSDTFQTVAGKLYDLEIDLLSDSVDDMRRSPALTPLPADLSPLHKRMSREKEGEMLARFQALIDRLP